jgi:predicted enzyme related to lactoylglutathione lyase
MRIKLTAVYVDDQDRARAFYTDVLGMQLKTDAAYGDGARWLTVVSPDDPDGPELLLEAPDGPAQAFQRARREAGRPATALATSDCHAEAQRLKAAGVRFVMEPTTLPYGGVDAVFDDTCGNLICIHQD